MLNTNLTKDSFITAGKIFKTIIDKERAGKYLGRDVQFIPHVTGEIKNFLRRLAQNNNADVVMVEIGGTVGDISSISTSTNNNSNELRNTITNTNTVTNTNNNSNTNTNSNDISIK